MRWPWHRAISKSERIAIEAEVWERFKRHIKFEQMAQDLRELRDENDSLRVQLGELTEMAPAELTPIVATTDGRIMEVQRA